jgi:hypothetical protein
MNDVSRMRVSDAERELVVAHLQHATTEGRLSLDELGDRVSAAYAAVTWHELEQVVEDLPAPPEPEPEPEPEVEQTPAPGSDISDALLAALVLGLGVSSPWGPVLGVFGVVLGVLALSMRREMSQVTRGLVLAGVGLGLLPPVFYLSLLLLLGS